MTSLIIAAVVAAAGIKAIAGVRRDPRWTRARIARQLAWIGVVYAVLALLVWLAVTRLPTTPEASALQDPRPPLVVTQGSYYRANPRQAASLPQSGSPERDTREAAVPALAVARPFRGGAALQGPRLP